MPSKALLAAFQEAEREQDDSEEEKLGPAPVTSEPAPPPEGPASSALDDLTVDQRSCVEEMSTLAPEEAKTMLVAFAESRNWDASLAMNQYAAAQRFREQLAAEDVNRVAQYIRIPDDAEGPDGCLVTLEDGRGGVARDRLGRPIVMSVGLPYGSTSQMVAQLAYALVRAESHALPGQVPGEVCCVLETEPRDGATGTFRFLDKNLRAVLDVQRAYFPGSLRASIHLCKVPRTMAFAFRLAKPFMDKRTYDNIKMHTSYAALDKFILPDCKLPHWGGTYDFDHEAYLQWRAREEGVKLTEKLFRFGDEDLAQAEAAWIDALTQESELGSLSAPELIVGPPRARKVGRASKGGTGMWGSTRWNQKLLVLARGCCMYFDSTDERSDSNRPKRVIPLSGALVRKQSEEKAAATRRFSNAPSERFEILLSTRTFTFGCTSAADRDDWLEALREEIRDADDNLAGTSGHAGSEPTGSPGPQWHYRLPSPTRCSGRTSTVA